MARRRTPGARKRTQHPRAQRVPECVQHPPLQHVEVRAPVDVLHAALADVQLHERGLGGISLQRSARCAVRACASRALP